MKRIFSLQFMISSLAILSFFFSSCNEINDKTLSSLTVSVDKSSITAGESFVFTATGDDEVDYTSSAQFYVNNNLITGNTYTTDTAGTYTVYAKYNDITSNMINIVVVLPDLTITADKPFIYADSGDSFVFTVMSNNEVDYTASAEFYVNGDHIAGNTYTTNTAGTYTVYAKYNNVSSNTITIEVVAVELTITVDKPFIYADAGDSFAFTVMGNDNVNYTSSAKFYVNNSLITGNTYTTNTLGTYTVYAKYDDITSNTITIEVLKDIPPLTNLTLTADKSSIIADSGDSFVFTVMGNDYENYSSSAEFYVNNSLITGNTYTTNTPGTYTVYAKYSDITSNTISIEVVLPELTITADKSYILVDSGESFVFTVMGSNNVNYTSSVEFYVNNSLIAGNAYTNNTAGTYTVYARYYDVNSNAINVKVLLLSSCVHQHKVLIEDFTGTWCPYCSRVLCGIKLLHEQPQGDRILVAAIHRNGSGTDPWNLPAGAQLESAHSTLIGGNFEGYPTAYLNRQADWAYPEYTHLTQVTNMLQSFSPYGIAISSTLGASSGEVSISFSFNETLAGAKFVVYILEDDLIRNQANAGTPSYCFGNANPLRDFVHKDVVRKVVSSSIMGEDIPAGQSNAGSVYTKSFSTTYTSSNVANLKVMVIILNSGGHVVNVQVAPANTNQNYEIIP